VTVIESSSSGLIRGADSSADIAAAPAATSLRECAANPDTAPAASHAASLHDAYQRFIDTPAFALAGTPMNNVLLRWQGRVDYAASFAAMRQFTEARDAATPDEIWLIEHPPVYTLGQAGDPAHLLIAADSSASPHQTSAPIPLVRSDRGGQITYHGPGQILAYLLIDLRRRGLMVKEFVQRIEQAVIETLAAYNLAGERHAGAPGIYLADGPLTGAKIAALGLKIRRGCSYHGVSLNVAMDLRPFDDINPCGYKGLKTVDMALAGVAADMQGAAHMLASRLLSNLPAMSPPHTDQR